MRVPLRLNGPHRLFADNQSSMKTLPSWAATRSRLPTLVLMLMVTGLKLPAQTYFPPPDWDPMLMLNVSLSPGGQLSVQSTQEIMLLTPAPGTYNATNHTYDVSVLSFDPTKPWSVLNGTAYSRVLGWYDQGTTGANGDNFYDTYAAQLNGLSLWIDKVGGSPEVQTYFINEDVTGDPGGPYTPIFGTAGSGTKWRWDGFMDHNANGVPLKNITMSKQIFTAIYHLYIGDTNGNPVTGYGDATTTWRWRGPAISVVPAPSLTLVGGQLVVSWSATITNLALLSATSLATPSWATVTNASITQNGRTTVTLPLGPEAEFFRLQVTP